MPENAIKNNVVCTTRGNLIDPDIDENKFRTNDDFAMVVSSLF